MSWETMTPRDRDALVARKVLGRTVARSESDQLPEYTTDYNAARLVEQSIDRRRHAYYDYVAYLCQLTDPNRIFGNGWGHEQVFVLLLATPEQRCHAALRACGVDI